jgi:repressor LexA
LEVLKAHFDVAAHDYVILQTRGMKKSEQVEREAAQRRRAFQKFIDDHNLQPHTWAKESGLSNANAIYNFLGGRSTSLSLRTLNALAAGKGYLVEEMMGKPRKSGRRPSSDLTATVQIIGEVQAGAWRAALTYPAGDQYELTLPSGDRFPGIKRYGLVVRGDSMDKIYPPGTVVVVVRFADIGQLPKTGDKVVVLRRSSGNAEYEATIKEYERDRRGRHVLWPRSSDPEFQEPFILTSPDLPVSLGSEQLPLTVFAAPIDAGEADLVVSGLVMGSWKNER